MSDSTPSASVPVPEPGKAPPRIPDYELLHRVGRGAYGEVWLARGVTGAFRAVKIVHRSSFDNERPFRREFEGILKFEPISRCHDSQVDILHVGRGDDYFYYVMELADDQATGGQIHADNYHPRTLKSDLLFRSRLPFEECVSVGIALTTALEHLHENGLVHRDIKPSNIIFVNGVAKLADIGLVTGVDTTRSYVGTEGFAAPEGAGTPQADLFSLGKVLYEMSTGKDRQQFPELPTNLRELPDREGLAELNAVIARACRHDPRDRYATAVAMRADLELLQSGKSLARLRAIERSAANLKRASLAIAAVTVLAFMAFLYQRFETAEARRLARENLRLAQQTKDLSGQSRGRLLQLQIANAIRVMDQGDLTHSLLWLAEAFKNMEGDAAREEMHRVRIASVLENCPKLAQVLVLDGPVYYGRFSPDGSRLVTLTSKELAVYDLGKGTPILKVYHSNYVNAVAFSSDGHSLIVERITRSNRVGLLDATTGANLISPDIKNPIAISPDGRLVFGLTDRSKGGLFLSQTGQSLGPLFEPGSRIRTAYFSRDGQSVAVGIMQNGPKTQRRVEVLETKTGERVGSPIKVSGGDLFSFVFSPDGSQVISTSKDPSPNSLEPQEVGLWRVGDGAQTSTFKLDNSRISIMKFSPAGHWVLIAPDRALYVWDSQSGNALGPPLKHPDVVEEADVSPDGWMLATGCRDGLTRIWNPTSGELLYPPLRSGMQVNDVQFSPDGRFLAVCGEDGLVRLWDLAGRHSPQRVLPNSGSVNDVGFSADGRTLVTSADTVRLWDVETGAAKSPVFDPAPTGVGRTRLSPDGRLAVSFAGPALPYRRTIEFSGAFVWETATARPLYPTLVTNDVVLDARFNPDGTLLATASGNGCAHLWDARTGQSRAKAGFEQVSSVTFSPDGRLLLTASRDGTAHVWDVATAKHLLGPLRHEQQIESARFSPDGATIVTTGYDQAARLWNATTGEPLRPPLFHPEQVEQAAFSPDGQMLLTAGLNSGARLWRLRQPEPLFAVLTHSDRAISSACFSPDGKLILTSSLDRTARIWAASTAEPVTVLLRHQRDIAHAEFSPDRSDVFVTGGYDEAVCLWRLNKWKQSVATLTELAELLSGHRLGFGGTLEPLKSAELAALFASLRGTSRELLETSGQDVLAWHREMAWEAERAGQWLAVVWHLDKLLATGPQDPKLLACRGTAQAELGHWLEARKDFEAALELDRADANHWHNLALVLTALDDPSDYQKLCSEAASQAQANTDPNSRYVLAEICALSPEGLQDYRPMLECIREAAQQRPYNPAYLRDRAILLYRMGDFLQAARALEDLRQMGPEQRADLMSATFLVLAELRLGRTGQATDLWREVAPRIAGWLKMKATDYGGPNWGERIDLNLWRREVETLLPANDR
jgi:WD40 repeat protein/tetratricopeptide (TPR) repeat protein